MLLGSDGKTQSSYEDLLGCFNQHSRRGWFLGATLSKEDFGKNPA